MSNLPQQSTAAYMQLTPAQRGMISDALTTTAISAVMVFTTRMKAQGLPILKQWITVHEYTINFAYDLASKRISVFRAGQADDMFTIILAGIQSTLIWGQDCRALAEPMVCDGIECAIATSLRLLAPPTPDVA